MTKAEVDSALSIAFWVSEEGFSGFSAETFGRMALLSEDLVLPMSSGKSSGKYQKRTSSR